MRCPLSPAPMCATPAEIFDHFAFDEEAVAEQARTILEDVPVQVIKVGFVGSPEN
jgi:hydroxymethylpyrimidine/phosphomethylpyrimidine kinase